MPSEISQFFVSMVLIAFFFTIVWLITRFLKPKSLEVTFDAPRKEAALAIVCVVAIFLTFAVVLAFIVRSAGRPLGTPEQFDLPGALRQWGIYAAISIIPTLVIIRIRKQGFQTVGATKKNFLLSFGIGNVLSMFLVLYVALAATPERFLYRFLDWNAFYAFISFLAVGFGEELMFRGFLQLRCSAWLGEIKGLILTSSIFALIHMPQRIFVVGLDPWSAFLSSVLLMPISLFFGFFMLRTQNIIGPAVLHTIIDWVNVL